MTFNERLKKDINWSKYTNKEIALYCNVSESKLYAWKAGKKYPDVHHLWRLSQLLHSQTSTLHHVKGQFFIYVKMIDSERK
tara:strand:- start:6 stop:248 length:243 start_codon:yes stop_codon:yes gene_type:complete